MQAAYLHVIVMLHMAFAAVFFFINRQRPSRFARLFALSWAIEGVRAAILVPGLSGLGGRPELWFAAADLLCFVATWSLLAGCADLAGVRLPRWLAPVYFWTGMPVVLFNRFGLPPLLTAWTGWPALTVRFYAVFANMVIMFLPVAVARSAVMVWLFRVWQRTRQPGALIAGGFCVPYALVALAVPVEFYFSYTPEWINFVWCVRVLGISIGLVMLTLNLQQVAVAKSEASLAAAQWLAKIGSWELDVATGVATCSAGIFRLYGREEAAGVMSYGEFRAAIHPEDREKFKRKKAEALQRLRDCEYEFRIVCPDGSLRWIRGHSTPFFNAAGKLVRLIGVEQDITERKELEAQFLRAQRLEAVGTLASGIAHDLNNILAPTLMVAGLMKEKVTDERDRELLEMVAVGARRGGDIIRQLLTFSRGAEGERVPLQVRHLIREIGSIVRETFPREIAFIEDSRREIWPVVADATQIHQALVNLCVNARDAMPHGGTLRIAVQNIELGEADLGANPGAKAGPHVRLTVADTGTGMSPEIMAQIFDPFFTTKEAGKGTGLGLSTTIGIVRSHGGFMTVSSEPGRGTSFEVYLPATPGLVDGAKVEDAAHVPWGGGELILVVDDEEAIRNATQQVLEQHNYRVIVVANGREAVAAFHVHRTRLSLVLTDVMMPEMGGVALARMLRAFSPALKFVVTSGLELEDQTREFAALGITEILAKPGRPKELLAAIRRELSGTRAV